MVRSLHAFSMEHLPRTVSHNRCAHRAEPLTKLAPKPAVLTRRNPPLAPHDDALLADIRLLGRMLGDAIREHEGKDAFDLIERIRRLSVAYRVKRDAVAGRTLDRLLKNLTVDQTVSVVRAFSYFSHLANIAEDRHHVRRREAHEQRGDL